MAVENQFDNLVVMESDKVVGVLTYWDLVKSHPNRIVADAMSDQFIYIAPDTPVWKAKEILDKDCVEILLVGDQQELVGIVNKAIIHVEISRHCDLLTGLYKSDYIYYQAMKLINRGSSIAFIFLDINNFGQIDKEYGHINGDRILQEIGMLLKTNMTEETYLARFGGDEFLVLTPYNVEQCCTFAQKLVSDVMGHHFAKDIPVTISAGIANQRENEYPEDLFSNLLKLINFASLASTQAKKNKSEFSIANNSCFSKCGS
jgi:diguanylate cyclase (GGDEF)-like protein